MNAPTAATTAPPLVYTAPARSLGRLRLIAPLARGALGALFVAETPPPQRQCALPDDGREAPAGVCVVKTVTAPFAREPRFLGRFVALGHAARAIAHPHLARVLSAGVEDGVPCVALEFVAGEDLARLLAAARSAGVALPVGLALGCGRAVLAALDAVHSATDARGRPLGLAHGDVSRTNVRVGWDGAARLLDVGLARTAAGGLADLGATRPVTRRGGGGGDDATTGRVRADVRAASVLVWELLAGLDRAERRAIDDAPPAPLAAVRADVPPALDALLAALIDGAYASAARALAALDAFATAHGVATTPDVTREVLSALLLDARPPRRDADEADVATTSIYVRPEFARPSAEPTLLDATRAETTRVDARPPWHDTLVTPDGVCDGVRAAAITALDTTLPDVAATAPSSRDTGAPSPATPRGALLAGTRYRLGERIGAGSSGEVYEAEQVDLGRRVALKILSHEHSRDPSVVARFRLEARAVAALAHPHIVPVWDFSATADGRLFLVMPRLLGMTLRERLARVGRLAPDEAMRVGAAVARGLAAAHAVGVVHRDVKPENIFLERDGGVRLLDFGVAKALSTGALGHLVRGVTREGEVFGSPAYMAPEHASGGRVEPRTDVYALGAVLYEALAGVRMFDDGTFVETLARHVSLAPPPLEVRAPGCAVPPAVEALVRWCLEKDPARRPASALELAAHLETARAAAAGMCPAPRARRVVQLDNAGAIASRVPVGVSQSVAAAAAVLPPAHLRQPLAGATFPSHAALASRTAVVGVGRAARVVLAVAIAFALVTALVAMRVSRNRGASGLRGAASVTSPGAPGARPGSSPASQPVARPASPLHSAGAARADRTGAARLSPEPAT